MSNGNLNLSLKLDSSSYRIEIQKMEQMTKSFVQSASQNLNSVLSFAGKLNSVASAASLVISGIETVHQAIVNLSEGQNESAIIAEKYNSTVEALSGSARLAQEGIDNLRDSINEMSASQAKASLVEVTDDFDKVRNELSGIVNDYQKFQEVMEDFNIEGDSQAALWLESSKTARAFKEGVADSIGALLEGTLTLNDYKDAMYDAFSDKRITKERLEELIKMGATYETLNTKTRLLKEHIEAIENPAQKSQAAVVEANEKMAESSNKATEAAEKQKKAISEIPAHPPVSPPVQPVTQPVEPVSNPVSANTDDQPKGWMGGWNKAKNSFVDEWTDSAKIAEKQFAVLANGIESIGSMAVDSIFDGAEFRVDKLFEEIAKQLIKIAITQALTSAISGAQTGLKSLFGLEHNGGIIGIPDANPGRRVSPLAFTGAPRYHTGGIAGLRSDEVPAILQRGEGIFTRGQMQAIGTGLSAQPQIDINFIDQTSGGTDVQMQQTPTANGGMRLDLTIIDVVNGNINSGGKLDRTLRGKYGLNARPNGR